MVSDTASLMEEAQSLLTFMKCFLKKNVLSEREDILTVRFMSGYSGLHTGTQFSSAVRLCLAYTTVLSLKLSNN